MIKDLASIRWLVVDGTPISCTEKLKVLREAVEEFRELASDALADAVVIGCSEDAVRIILHEIVDGLETPFKPRI